MWTGEDALRAPVGDFPPPYASAWGDDVFGLFVDVILDRKGDNDENTLRLRWIESQHNRGRVTEFGFWMLPESIARDNVERTIAKIHALLVDNEKGKYEIRGYDEEKNPEKEVNSK